MKKKSKPRMKNFLVEVEYQPHPDSHEEVVRARTKKEALKKFYDRNYLDGDVLEEKVTANKKPSWE